MRKYKRNILPDRANVDLEACVIDRRNDRGGVVQQEYYTWDDNRQLVRKDVGVITRPQYHSIQQDEEANLMWKKKFDALQQVNVLAAQAHEVNIRKEERDKCQKEIQELILNQEMEKLMIRKQAKEEYEKKINEIIAAYEANKKKEIERIVCEVEERVRREERERIEKEEESDFILVCG